MARPRPQPGPQPDPKTGPPGAESTREVLRALYETHAPAVHARCRYLLRDPADAEDALHEVFAKALLNLEGFRGEASQLTWLMKIATHHCLNLERSRTAGWRERFRRTEAARADRHDGPRALEARDQVRRVMAGFDLETRRAVVHYHLDQMTLQEVADALGRSVPTVRKRLDRFARALAESEALP